MKTKAGESIHIFAPRARKAMNYLLISKKCFTLSLPGLAGLSPSELPISAVRLSKITPNAVPSMVPSLIASRDPSKGPKPAPKPPPKPRPKPSLKLSSPWLAPWVKLSWSPLSVAPWLIIYRWMWSQYRSMEARTKGRDRIFSMEGLKVVK